jgi:hypothetical protein
LVRATGHAVTIARRADEERSCTGQCRDKAGSKWARSSAVRSNVTAARWIRGAALLGRLERLRAERDERRAADNEPGPRLRETWLSARQRHTGMDTRLLLNRGPRGRAGYCRRLRSSWRSLHG